MRILSSSHHMQEASSTHLQDVESRQKAGHTIVVPSFVPVTPHSQSAHVVKVDAAAQAFKKAKKRRKQVGSRKALAGSGQRMPLPSELPQYTTLNHDGYKQRPDSVLEEHRYAPFLAFSEAESMEYPPNTRTPLDPAQVPSSRRVQHFTRHHDSRFQHLSSDHTNVSPSAEQYTASTPHSHRDYSRYSTRPIIHHDMLRQDISNASSSNFFVRQQQGPQQGIGSSAGIPMHPTDHRHHPDVQFYESPGGPPLDGTGNSSFGPRPYDPYEEYFNPINEDK